MKMLEFLMNLKIDLACECESVLVFEQQSLGL